MAESFSARNGGLTHILTEAQRIGALGAQPIGEVIDHALAFAEALPGFVQRCVDLGSGAGVPGLVIALARPDLQLTLVDRRSKRTDSLERAVRALDIGDRVTVVCADVEQFCQHSGVRQSFDAACARGFGPPEYTLNWSTTLVRSGGVVVISEPPITEPDRWASMDLGLFGVTRYERHERVALFHVEHSDTPQ